MVVVTANNVNWIDDDKKELCKIISRIVNLLKWCFYTLNSNTWWTYIGIEYIRTGRLKSLILGLVINGLPEIALQYK